MEHNSSGAAKRSNLSSGVDDVAGEDRISALPDDILVLILIRLCTSEAAQTSVLSRRWRCKGLSTARLSPPTGDPLLGHVTPGLLSPYASPKVT
ncbi:hypothetical protein EJB05_13985, partial [Eragrostis curvula]